MSFVAGPDDLATGRDGPNARPAGVVVERRIRTLFAARVSRLLRQLVAQCLDRAVSQHLDVDELAGLQRQ